MLHYFRADTEAIPPPETPASIAYAKRKGIPHDDLALNPAWALCVCAGFALDDGPIIDTTSPIEFARAFLWAIRGHGKNLFFVAHNADYDIGVLLSWMIRGGVPDFVIRLFVSMCQGKPWERKVICTMRILGTFYTLDGLAHMLGVAGKTDHIGGSIAELWKTDKPRVISYMRGDVEALRLVHVRLLELGLGKVQ